MSDNDSDNAQPKIGYIAEYDRRGAASCKKCKQRLVKGQVRLGKAAPNPFSDKPEDTMKSWFHVQCMFDTLQRARATTKKIESVADLEGFEKLAREDQKSIEQHIKAFNEAQGKRKGAKGAKAAASPQKTSDAKAARNVSTPAKPAAKNTSAAPADDAKLEEELSFRTYRKLCADMADESGYIAKSRILSEFLKRGLSGAGFRGDLRVLLGLFLPQEVAAVYNLKDKQLVKLFGLLFQADQDAMLADLSAGGDVSETIRKFFESSSGVRPAAHSTLSQKDVADWLAKLTELTKADDQRAHLGVIARRSTSNDLKMIVRLIKKDIRINAGAKHVLDALDPSAHESYSALQDLDAVVARFVSKDAAGNSKTKMAVGSELMKPVSPMLAAQCRSAVEALQHAPGGLFAEVKYDGERVQLHKRGNSFLYFSRNLKPVVPHKVVELQPFIADAFPGVNDIILDSEVLVVDTRTGKPLPFGTLGVHKKNSAGEHASTCIFVFDILHLNGVDLMRKYDHYLDCASKSNVNFHSCFLQAVAGAEADSERDFEGGQEPDYDCRIRSGHQTRATGSVAGSSVQGESGRLGSQGRQQSVRTWQTTLAENETRLLRRRLHGRHCGPDCAGRLLRHGPERRSDEHFPDGFLRFQVGQVLHSFQSGQRPGFANLAYFAIAIASCANSEGCETRAQLA